MGWRSTDAVVEVVLDEPHAAKSRRHHTDSAATPQRRATRNRTDMRLLLGELNPALCLSSVGGAPSRGRTDGHGTRPPELRTCRVCRSGRRNPDRLDVGPSRDCDGRRTSSFVQTCRDVAVHPSAAGSRTRSRQSRSCPSTVSSCLNVAPGVQTVRSPLLANRHPLVDTVALSFVPLPYPKNRRTVSAVSSGQLNVAPFGTRRALFNATANGPGTNARTSRACRPALLVEPVIPTARSSLGWPGMNVVAVAGI